MPRAALVVPSPPILRVTARDWHAIGSYLFDKDPRSWKFQCPACGHVQSAAELIAQHPELDTARLDGHAYTSCAGRLLPAVMSPPKKARGPKRLAGAPPSKRVVKKAPRPDPAVGCDWTLGGLFSIHALEVLHPETKAWQAVFMFFHVDAREALEECDVVLPPPETTDAATWSEYSWPDWVPLEQRAQIEKFWGASMGRSPEAWLHGSGGRHAPRLGEEVTMRPVCHGDVPKVTGRFVYCWNNMARVVDAAGVAYAVAF
jgi:hypothetical protein